MDFLTAIVAIQDLKSAYQARRSEDKLNKLISKFKTFCKRNSITSPASEIATPSPKRRRCLPTRFRDGQTIMTASNSLAWNYSDDSDSVAYRFRQNFFYPFLDKLLSELDKGFSDQACDLLSDAAAFYPQHLSPTNVHKIENLAKFYKLDGKLVGQQYLLFSQSIIYKNWKLDYENHQKNSTKTCWMCLPTLLKLFGQNNLHHLYTDLFRMIVIVATLPVTVASCKRAHSKVKLINNYLRVTMSSERLKDFVEINCERDISDSITLDRMVEAFKLAGERRLKL